MQRKIELLDSDDKTIGYAIREDEGFMLYTKGMEFVAKVPKTFTVKQAITRVTAKNERIVA
jgi:hypothetical protein